MIKLISSLPAAVIGAAMLFATPVFGAFNYTVNYTDSFNNATYPGAGTITTTDILTYFTVQPGGSVTGSVTPTTVGLFTITPVTTEPSGNGPYTVSSTAFTATVSIQTVANLDGSGPIGAPATFVVTGNIGGTLGPDSDSTKITGIAGIPTSVVAGGITYDIALDSVRNPGVVSSEGNSGGVSLDITQIPEPTTLSLIGIGAAGVLARRRKTA